MSIVLHKYQEQAFLSDKQIIINAAGIQSGKTTLGAIWLIWMIGNGPTNANYILVAPTYKILAQASLPRFLELTKGMGTYHKVDGVFRFNHGPVVFIRSLTDGDSIEGITSVFALWLDEGGLISRYSWENCMGRCAFKQAPLMVTTTPYSLNWMFQIWRDWKDGKRDDVEFLTYRSIDNPFFPKAEYERQKRILDPVRFRMKYDGVFGRMEGLVYPNVAFIKSIPLPPGTQYYAGVDWGYTNPFALVVRAVTSDGVHYRVAEFCKSGMTMDEITQVCLSRQQMFNIKIFVCDPSNPAAIKSLNEAGLKAIGGNNDIQAGIDAMRGLMNLGKFFVFEDENPFGYDEFQTYHYPEPKDLKMDDDEKEQLPVAKNDHSLDADRYITMYLKGAATGVRRTPTRPDQDKSIPQDALKRLDWLKRGGSSRDKLRG